MKDFFTRFFIIFSLLTIVIFIAWLIFLICLYAFKYTGIYGGIITVLILLSAVIAISIE